MSSGSWWVVVSVLFVAATVTASGCDDEDVAGPTESEPTNSGPPGLRIVLGDAQTDTVRSTLLQAVVIELRDANGAVVSGAVARFEPLPSQSGAPGVLVASLASSSFSTFAVDSTNSVGRTGAVVQLGTVAGTAMLKVTVPEAGLVDTAHFTVTPGMPAHVVATPSDTALYVTHTFQSRGAVTDQFGNPRADPVQFAALGGITVSASGMVTTGPGFARGWYTVSAGGVSDTGWVSVVPQGTLAALQTSTVAGHGPGLVVFNLDGSSYQWITTAGLPYNGAGTTWTSTGARMAFGNTANWITTTNLAGAIQSVPTVGDSGLTSVSWPAYSHDGAYLYFSGVTNGNYALWRADADGSNPHLWFTDPSGLAWRESPSPDGTRLAYTANGQAEIHVLTVATHAASPLLSYGHTPRWSPVADVIAFTNQYGGPVYVMNADGSGKHQVSPLNRPYGEGSLTWSNDGVWLVVRGPQVLEVLNVASGLALPLAFTGGMHEPSWKP